jgi:hypothetical protein
MMVIKPRRMTQVKQVAHTQQKQEMHEIFQLENLKEVTTFGN